MVIGTVVVESEIDVVCKDIQVVEAVDVKVSLLDGRVAVPFGDEIADVWVRKELVVLEATVCRLVEVVKTARTKVLVES